MNRRYLTPKKSFGFFGVSQRLVVIPASTVLIAAFCMSRIGLIFGNGGGNTFRIGINNPLGANEGLTITTASQPVEIRHKDYGSLVGVEWFGSSAVGGAQVTVIETVYFDDEEHANVWRNLNGSGDQRSIRSSPSDGLSFSVKQPKASWLDSIAARYKQVYDRLQRESPRAGPRANNVTWDSADAP